MNVRRLAAVAALLAIGVALGRTAGLAQDDKQAGDKQASGKQAQSFAVQVAKANLQLAQMNLERMEQLNKKVPGTLITGMVQQFSEEVALAKTELEIAQKYPSGNSYLATVERMRLALDSAKDRAKRALTAHEQAPEIVTKNDVERIRQMAIIADLQLQRGMALADASPSDQLQWQMEVYGDELDRVRVYTYLLGQNRFGEFSPGL